MIVHFTPATGGGWFALRSGETLLVLGTPAEQPTIDALWAAISGPTGFRSVLDVLTARGLAATPPFGLFASMAAPGSAHPGATLQAIVRGAVTATATASAADGARPAGPAGPVPRGVAVAVDGPPTLDGPAAGDGPILIDGSGVSTWLETTVTDVASVTIAMSGPVAADNSVRLPLGDGGAMVASVELRLGNGPASGPRTNGFGDVASAEIPAAESTVALSPSTAGPAALGLVTVTPGPPAEQTGILDTDPGATVTDLPTERLEAPDASPETPADGYDYLFGATVFRDVASAAVLEPVSEDQAQPESPTTGPPPIGAPPIGAPLTGASPDGAHPDGAGHRQTPGGDEPLAGDHDGHTVLTSDIARLRAPRAATRGRAVPTAAIAHRMFLAFSDGRREALTQPILVGRSPSVSQVSGGQMPRLITVGTPEQDISRTHVRFALEGGTVVVTDLHSRNGTLVVLPGKEPQKLRAGEPTSVITGTVVDLGGGITLTVHEDAS